MSIERERKFITSIDQAHQLAGDRSPTHITQHYLSPTDTDDELRIRSLVSGFTDSAYVATIKQGHGEYRLETEIPLLATAYLTLSTQALATLLKNRYELPTPGLTLDRCHGEPASSFGILELEQMEAAPDIGLFDPRSLNVGDMTEVTGLPDFSSRSIATPIAHAERESLPLEYAFATIKDLLRRSDNHPVIITLSGPSGSGKTTLLSTFTKRFGDACTFISTDDYYIGRTAMQTKMPEGHATNFDHPAALNTTQLARDIQALRAGHTINRPHYDMTISEPTGQTTATRPTPLIIIEGLAANLPTIRENSDLSITLTSPIQERLRRRMERDITRKGHTPERTLDIFMNHVEPSYQTYFAPHDNETDITISN